MRSLKVIDALANVLNEFSNEISANDAFSILFALDEARNDKGQLPDGLMLVRRSGEWSVEPRRPLPTESGLFICPL